MMEADAIHFPDEVFQASNRLKLIAGRRMTDDQPSLRMYG